MAKAGRERAVIGARKITSRFMQGGELVSVKKKTKSGIAREIKALKRKLNRSVKTGQERDKLKEILLQSEEAFRGIIDFNQTLLSSMPLGIDIVDEEGNVLFFNKNIALLTGEKIKDKKCWELYRDDKKPCDDCPLGKGMGKGGIDSFEVAGMFGGKIYQITHTGMTYNGKKAMLELFQDITIRKKAEESLKETMRMKSNFVSMVSHELRTPLIVIKEGVNTVINSGEVNEKQRQFLDMIERNAARLSKLVRSVLNFQKLDSGKEEFSIEENDINGVIKEVSETLLFSAKKKDLDIRLELDKDLPAIRFDRDKIVQVLMNLVSNSIKFTDKGCVTISAGAEKGSIRVTVRDTGPGIKKEDIVKLFQAFEQLGKNRDKSKEGTGLGLSISKEIIERHKGKIWAESEEGKWTAFTFTLPA